MIELTTPSLCDIEQYISPESIADGTYIKPVAVVLCLGNLVNALVPSRNHIAKTMFKSNNNPPNNKYKLNWTQWTQNESCLPPNAQALPQWRFFNVNDQEKPAGYPKPQNQPRSDSKQEIVTADWHLGAAHTHLDTLYTCIHTLSHYGALGWLCYIVT